MLVLNLPFKALMFLTLMRPSLVLFLVLWLKLVKDFLKVRCRLDRKSGSAGMPRPISYAVFCLKKKKKKQKNKTCQTNTQKQYKISSADHASSHISKASD